MSRRTPAPHPELAGFTYEALLGSGGFADVFLYRQHLPERRVAVKVLLPDRLAQGTTDAFTTEANMMAQLSTHPAIVTIHQAGVSDDGRPYLVMEYCPKPNLQVRYRREPFSVAESLRVGVQVAAAVETAHRAGILHRDIKPANILVTEYNRPALTDFGIATPTAGGDESAGMSIPWSPPESFADDPQTGVATDVWGLGATVYTLLAGRSPFELPGERNTSADLMQRIESLPLPPLGRPDAPASLQAVLERAMAKSPHARYLSAIDVARALQRVQIELSMAPTPIDVLEDAGPDAPLEHDEDAGLTRVRNIVSIDPAQQTSAPAPLPPAAVPTFAPTTAPGDTAAPGSTTRSGTGYDTTAPADGETIMRADRDAAAGLISGRSGSPAAPHGPVAPSGSGASFASDIRPPSYATGADRTVRRPAAIPAQHDTTQSSPQPGDPTAPDPTAVADLTVQHDSAPARRRSRGGLIAAIIGAVVVVGVIVVVWGADRFGMGTAEPSASASPTSAPVEGVVPDGVPTVTDVAGQVQGDQVVFTWTNPQPLDGDVYLWRMLRLGEDTQLQPISEPTVTVPLEPGGRTCIEVALVRSNGTGADTTVQGCAP